MTTQYLKYSKFKKLYNLEYKGKQGKVTNYEGTVVYKFDVATQEYIKFNAPENAFPSYYWTLDRLYIYDNDPENIIDWMDCNFAYYFEKNKVFKYSLSHKANLYEGEKNDYTAIQRQIMRNLVLYTPDGE